MFSRFKIFKNFFDDKTSQGSAFVLALVVTTILTVICTLVLKGNYLQRKLSSRFIHEQQAQYLAEAGIQKTMWLLSGNGGKNFQWRPVNDDIDLMDKHTAQVTVVPYGGFLKATSHVRYKKWDKTIEVIFAQVPPEPFERAVTLGESYPLVVMGKNRIVGDVSVGLKGVELGRIDGRWFEGEKPVEGKIERVQFPELPHFDATLFQQALKKYETWIESGETTIYIESELDLNSESVSSYTGQSLYVSGNVTITCDSLFTCPPIIICSGDVTIQGSGYLIGEMEIAASGKVIIKDQVEMQDCILYSRQEIDVSGQCRVQGQLLCAHDINIRENTVLSYPSVVYCDGWVKDRAVWGEIEIKDQAVVQGMVIMNTEQKDLSKKRNETNIYIDKNAKVIGAVYSSNYVTLLGTVYGSIATDVFHLYISPTTYKNYLKDTTIDRTQLPDVFLMPFALDKDPVLQVLRWREWTPDSPKIVNPKLEEVAYSAQDE